MSTKLFIFFCLDSEDSKSSPSQSLVDPQIPLLRYYRHVISHPEQNRIYLTRDDTILFVKEKISRIICFVRVYRTGLDNMAVIP